MLVTLLSDRNLAALPAGGNVGFVKLEEGCGKSCPEIADSVPAFCFVLFGLLGLFSFFARCRVEWQATLRSSSFTNPPTLQISVFITFCDMQHLEIVSLNLSVLGVL